MKSKEELIEYIKQVTQNSEDIVYKKIQIEQEYISMIYVDTLGATNTITNLVKGIREIINEQIKINQIDKMLDGSKNRIQMNKKSKEIKNILEKMDMFLTVAKIKKIEVPQDDMFYYLYSGFTLVLYQTNIFAVETREDLERSISEPTTEFTIKGPKDAFGESYSRNIGLIRKRLKNEQLIVKQSIVGRRTKTKVGVMYIADICRPELAEYVIEKISKIEIDGIIDSNYIAELINSSNKDSFPTFINTERPDLVTFHLLEGRVAIIVENTPYVLVLPAFINDFINNIDDYYQKSTNISFTRVVRYIAFLIAILLPGLYIALITFNQEAIPTEFLLSFTSQRTAMPFPAFIEAIFMLLAFEILRESDYRIPTVAGSTLSIVGALILGDAAVSAGIVSSIMIIVIALSIISSLLISDVNMANAIRVWRFVFLFFATIAGLMGIGIALILFIVKLSSVYSFGKSFLYPIAPFNKEAMKSEMVARSNIKNLKKRFKILTDNHNKQTE